MARLLLRRDLTVAVIVLLFAIQATVRYSSHIDPAVGWYLYAGGRLLDGAALYSDIFEVNPPLALWLCAAIVAFARDIAVDPIVLFKTILFLLTGASLVVSARLLAAANDVTAGTRNVLLIFVAALMLFLPAAEFGLRDHVAIVLVTPWVLLRWNRLLDRRVPWALAALIGTAAAVAIWLKPHFVFVPIAIEVTMLFATRSVRASLRVETLTVIAFGIGYLVLIRLMWSSTLLTTIALYGSRAYIPIYGVPFEDVAVRLILPIALAATAVASTKLLTEQLQLLRTLLFVGGATFVCAYVLQAGSRDQTIPALHFLAFAASLSVARALAGELRLMSSSQRLVVAGAAISILAVFVGVSPNQVTPYRGQLLAEAISAEAPDARTILVASADVGHGFPLINETGLIWASRFPALWLSPYVATKLDDEGGPNDDIARFALEVTVDDLIAFEPDVVLIDEAPERPHYDEAPLDYLDFWEHDPRFFRFWKSYQQRGTAGDFAVYVRTPTQSPGSKNTRSNGRADPFGCILAEVIGSYC